MSRHPSLYVSAFAIVLGLLLVPSAVSADDDDDGGVKCKNVKGSLTSVADLANFTTEGTIRGSFRGATSFVGDGASLAPIMSAQSPPLAPTFSYTGDLTIHTKKGSITTRGVGVFELIPFGLGTQFDTVIDGTGDFAGATGFLQFSFRANAAADGFVSSYTGQICRVKNGDDDDD